MFKSKILSKNDYDSLLAKANSYTKIVSVVVENNPGITAEEVTPEIIEQMMQAETDPELQSKFDALQKSYSSLEKERNELKSQVTNLLNAPAEDSAEVTSASEMDGKNPTLLDFASKNRGNTAAIIQEAQKDGFLPY